MAKRIAVASRYTAAEFDRFVRRESDRIERKSGASGKPLQEAMVAFSNSAGGVIFIGVADDGRVLGRTLDQATEDRIHAAAIDAHNVGRYQVRAISVDDRPVIAVEVQSRQEGIAQTSDGRILVRRGARNQPVIGDDVWRLAAARRLRRFEQAPSGVVVEMIDEEALVSMCGAHGWRRDDPHLEDRLKERGLLADDELSIAGALLLTRPAESLATSKFVVEIRSYDDQSVDYRRREVFGGPLYRQVEQASKYISDELGSDFVVVGLVRHELPRLPAVVVREAVANAVAHRSYEIDRSAVVVEIRPHSVTVTSPGSLPEGVTVETMRQAQAARNPIIIDVLRRFGLAEDAGRGVDVMQDKMRDEMLEPPLFEEISGFVRVTLQIQAPITPEERAWLRDLEARGSLEPEDRFLLAHASRGEVLTNARARQITGLDPVAARTALRRLRDTGFLVQQGHRGGTSYLAGPGLTFGRTRRLTSDELLDVVLKEAQRRPIRNEDVRRLTGLDRDQALALLRAMVWAGQLVRQGSRRGTEYVAP